MIFVFFAAGAVIGSFLNVCIFRLPRKESIVFPGSHCPVCSHQIPFYHNIPIISYLFLRGRCSHCKHPISMRYIVVEILSGLLTVLAFQRFGLTIELPYYLILVYSLIVISFIDFDTNLILNKLLILLFGASLVFNLIFNIIDWKTGALGFAAGGGILLLFAVLGRYILKKESMGMGDVKLAAVMGFFLGWKLVLAVLYAGFVIALLYYLAVKIFNSKSAQKRIPMAPFFSIAMTVFILYGDTITNFYIKNILIN